MSGQRPCDPRGRRRTECAAPRRSASSCASSSWAGGLGRTTWDGHRKRPTTRRPLLPRPTTPSWQRMLSCRRSIDTLTKSSLVHATCFSISSLRASSGSAAASSLRRWRRLRARSWQIWRALPLPSAVVSAVWRLGQQRGPVGPPTRIRVWVVGSGRLGPRLMGGGRVGRPWGGAHAPL